MFGFGSWLAESTLNTDGRAEEVVAVVLEHPQAFPEALDCLKSANPVVRGHAADALEKIGREKPELFLPHLDLLAATASRDPVAMVQWHLAMLFGHLAVYPETLPPSLEALRGLIKAKALFTQSWAATSLAVIGCLYPEHQQEAIDQIVPLRTAPSAALRKRADTALAVLTGVQPFPKGWVKSPAVRAKLGLQG